MEGTDFTQTHGDSVRGQTSPKSMAAVAGDRLHPNLWQEGEGVDLTTTHGRGGERGQTSSSSSSKGMWVLCQAVEVAKNDLLVVCNGY